MDDEESDEYGAKPRKTNRGIKRRKGKKRSSYLIEVDEYTRVNTRNGRELPNYNEEDMTMRFSESDEGYEYYEPGEARRLIFQFGIDTDPDYEQLQQQVIRLMESLITSEIPITASRIHSSFQGAYHSYKSR